MESDFFIESSGRPGLRLHKLEFYNWGTFDSSDGSVHTIRPEGRTSLLVGRNGSGKSTLTDALITLLVRPGVRNYNVAAGTTQRKERNERTYVRGAFDHGSVEGESGRSSTRYLRDGKRGLYSVILGVFRNEDGDGVFTVAQILYLTADDRVDKVYAFASEEKSIAGDLSGFTSFDRFRAQVQERGFEAATTFSQYEKWLKRAGGFRDKAMDVFNQTVAVKDIQSLNGFIRSHMLEKRDWKDQVARILNHFSQLSEAHRLLVEARQQLERLVPIRKIGQKWLDASEGKRQLERIKEASSAWFRQRCIDLFTPLLEKEKTRLEASKSEQEELESSLEKAREDERQIRNELDEQGGERLKQLPHLIQRHEESATRKRSVANRLRAWLQNADCGELPEDREGFARLQEQLEARKAEVAETVEKLEKQQTGFSVQLYSLNQQISELEGEIEALSRRKTNLPENFVEVRRRICEALHLPEADLPFAAELMAVKSEHRDWEASIEMVLRSFGLSLLVPEGHYRQVSELVNRTRLVDHKGHGQRLVYRKIGHRVFETDSGEPHLFNDAARLPSRLDFREGRPLVPWLRQEIANRYNYLCCESIGDFQQTHGLAMTRERHLKTGGDRHEKDDRRSAADPSRFVLGWDNREKLQLLREKYREEVDKKEALEREQSALKSAVAKNSEQLSAIKRALEFSAFDEIDFRADDLAVAALREEKRALETGSEAMRILRERLDSTREEIKAFDARRDSLVALVDRIEKQIEAGERLIQNARDELGQWEASGELPALVEIFPQVAERFGEREFIFETFATEERDFKESLDNEIRAASKEITPLEERLTERMGKFLTKFSIFQNEMRATAQYTGSFLELLDRIEREDLPRHELRFKERLNEKVTQEIGFLNGELLTEARQIRTNIDLLNEALRNLEYREGTHMQLEPRDVRDREIVAFKKQLHDCLSDSFEGTLAADEDRFKRIEKLIIELRDEERWRTKVTDVRQWYDFFANEIETATGEERSSYSDSAGRSGGEKAKLAFTILVAAIAYQYQIDPHRETSERFHFVVVDEMFSKVDDDHAEYALRLFQKFGLQLLIVAPLDAKARITEDYVDFYLLATKEEKTSHSRVYSMTAGEYRELAVGAGEGE